MNHKIMFFDRNNKINLVPASFSYFLNSYETTIDFSLTLFYLGDLMVVKHLVEVKLPSLLKTHFQCVLGLFLWHTYNVTLSCTDDTKKSGLTLSWRPYDVISQSDITKDPKIWKIVKIVLR